MKLSSALVVIKPLLEAADAEPPNFKRFVIGGDSRNGYGYDTGFKSWSSRCLTAIESWLGQFGTVSGPTRDVGPNRTKMLRWDVGGRKFCALTCMDGYIGVFEE